jgi:hypothetical protein
MYLKTRLAMRFILAKFAFISGTTLVCVNALAVHPTILPLSVIRRLILENPLAIGPLARAALLRHLHGAAAAETGQRRYGVRISLTDAQSRDI